jgi:Beta/Gamma crystallin
LCAVILFYYNCDYRDLMASLGVGSYTAAALKLLQMNGFMFANNLRSLTIPPGFSYKVTLYSSDNFLGQSYTFTANVPCLSTYSFNDKTQSLIIAIGVALFMLIQIL